MPLNTAVQLRCVGLNVVTQVVDSFKVTFEYCQKAYSNYILLFYKLFGKESSIYRTLICNKIRLCSLTRLDPGYH
jgi:hypothetical protein